MRGEWSFSVQELQELPKPARGELQQPFDALCVRLEENQRQAAGREVEFGCSSSRQTLVNNSQELELLYQPPLALHFTHLLPSFFLESCVGSEETVKEPEGVSGGEWDYGKCNIAHY